MSASWLHQRPIDNTRKPEKHREQSSRQNSSFSLSFFLHLPASAQQISYSTLKENSLVDVSEQIYLNYSTCVASDSSLTNIEWRQSSSPNKSLIASARSLQARFNSNLRLTIGVAKVCVLRPELESNRPIWTMKRLYIRLLMETLIGLVFVFVILVFAYFCLWIRSMV